MQSSLRLFLVPLAVALAAAMAVAAVVIASNRQPVFLTTPSASVSLSTIEPAILTSGDATVSKKPDLAIVSAGIDSQQSSASGAQADLADKAGKTLDAIVQEGGATQITVSFSLADPKSAQAEARTLAIGEAKSKAQAMASAAGVKVGQVIRVSDLSTVSRYPISYGAAAGAPAPTQVPVGQVDVQVSVEVDFAIA